MKELAKIHDMCLELEWNIDADTEMLCDKRIKAYKSRDKESFKEILPVLNEIEQDVESYREYIHSLMEDGSEE